MLLLKRFIYISSILKKEGIFSVGSLKGQGPNETFPAIERIVLGMTNLKIRRVTKTYDFETCTNYFFETQVVIENQGKDPCYVVPGELYPKHVLVDFAVFDEMGKRCVYIPSSLNDQIVLKYFFLKLWKMHKDKKELLFKLFVDKSGETEDMKKDLSVVLSEEFNGDFAGGFFRAMWSAEHKIKEILMKPVLSYLSEEDKKKFRGQENLTVGDLCDDELGEFAEQLDDNFLLMIQLNTPLLSHKCAEITLRDTKFMSTEQNDSNLERTLSGLTKYKFDLDLKTVLPHQDTTFHVKILPPEGVKIDLKTRLLYYFFRKPHLLLLWRGQIIDPEKFGIFHQDRCCPNSICQHILKKLKIRKRGVSFFGLLGYRPPLEMEHEVPDVRAQLQEDIVYLYFGGRNRRRDTCQKRHKLLFSLNLKHNAIRMYHFAIAFLWVALLFPITVWLMWKSTTNLFVPTPVEDAPYSLMSRYFWSIMVMILGQSVAAMVDYSRRPTSERFFLARTFSLIALLTVLELILLIVLPFVLPIIASQLLN